MGRLGEGQTGVDTRRGQLETLMSRRILLRDGVRAADIGRVLAALDPAYEGPVAATPSTLRATSDRIVCDGKHLRRGATGYRVKGVTYGSFAARSDGALFPEPDQIRRDLATMADAGLNTIRTYSLPPADLWDAAEEQGIAVLV